MMRYVTAAVLVGALTLVPAAGFASQAATKPATKPAAKTTSTTTAKSSQSTTGVVKSIDATTLVLEHPGKKAREMTFTLEPSTQREGTIAAGSNVSVRYHSDGKTHVATAVMAAKAPAEKK